MIRDGLILKTCTSSTAVGLITDDGPEESPEGHARTLSAAAVPRGFRCFAAKSAGGTGHVTDSQAPKAALLLIGNEILSGSIQDANTPWLAKLLYNRGIDLVRIEVIPDEVEEIKNTVLQLKRRVGDSGIIFTSGGIGPTHDDVTYEAIAAAFGGTLERHKPTVERMQKHYDERGVELNEARLRMATLPYPATQVLFTEGLWVPLVVIQGVHILPGIPRLFQQMVGAQAATLPTGPTHVRLELGSNLGEGDIAQPLSSIAQEFPQVNIGSYPQSGDSRSCKVLLRFEGRNGAAVNAATSAARERIETFDI